ncbi:MAG: ATP-binding cassette domain-containing protein [Clostridia bacterium]|nr:ATP-binding cassette domain-containing protein [Clostridia bacterium]
MEREIILHTANLTKKYMSHYVLNKVEMTVRKGDIYGFVGRNGAGKTTLIRVISGLVVPDEGEFTLFGVNSKSAQINAARRKTCAMVESPSIYPELSAVDNMKCQCRILRRGTGDIKELLNYVGLGETGKKKAGDFSLGMRQRLYIAMALLGEPEFMLLDEPINGLDPEGIKDVRELLLKLNREKGITILISSHILTELEMLATTYAFIDDGKILKEISAEEIAKATKSVSSLAVSDEEKALASLKAIGYEAWAEGGKVFAEGEIDLMKTCERFKEDGIYLEHFSYGGMDLEEYFIKLIGGAE